MRCLCLLTPAIIWVLALSAPAQELDVERLFEDRNLAPVARMLNAGEYQLCGRICEAAIREGMQAPEWRVMRVQALLLQGEESQAQEEVKLALQSFPDHLELLMLQHETARLLGNREAADQTLAAINAAAKNKNARDRSAQEWVSLGQAALALGADARKVIQQYYAVAQKKDPKLESAYLAEGLLALEKDDAARAADVFRAGLKAHGESARLRAGLARAFASSDREKQMENLTRALEQNPRLEEAHLMRAEALIGAEKFAEAEASLQKVLETKANSPEAWALKAAIATLSGAPASKSQEARQRGLQRHAGNPAVDHLIGRIISRAYRFEEGAAHQRQALAFDGGYLPAKVQLCHDLLRLGEEEEAWKLAAEIREKDGYNVQAHNIGLLEKEMQGYVTRSYPDFVLKMPKRDWPVYGERALELLREARAVLCPKYGLELKRPVLVEFFGAQQDFAIRTFGSLGGQGLLGVCFGTVITMNSPGSLAHGRNNWESTLWHEFCHVVTLTLTRNRMPRWLSEGISVHEESQRDPVWGMKMNATFRAMILEEKKATPVSQLSSAFLNAESEDHLMFAYFQSAQVVDYLLNRFGPEALQAVLRDLAVGKKINDALAAHTEDLEDLDKDFARHLENMAVKNYGPEADWSKPGPQEASPLDPSSLAVYLQEHPGNLWALRQMARHHIEKEEWDRVLELGERLIRLLPEEAGAGSGYELKALALGKLERKEEEQETWRHIAALKPDAMAIFLQLIEADKQSGNWAELQVNARRAMALNPFLRTPQEALAAAAEAQGEIPEAVQACQRLLLLDPATAGATHLRLARLLKPADPAQAKRHLLDALSFAPRSREAYTLLRDWE